MWLDHPGTCISVAAWCCNMARYVDHLFRRSRPIDQFLREAADSMSTTTMPLAAADLEKVQSLALALRSLSSIAQSSTLAYPRVRPGWPRGAVGTEWKCPWNFGHSQCAMLFLAHGQPLSAESEAAIQWAMQLKQRLKSAILNYSLEHWPSSCVHGGGSNFSEALPHTLALPDSRLLEP